MKASDLKVIAERCADVPDLYDRICRQLLERDAFIAVDETPHMVVLENVGGKLVVSKILFQSSIEADRVWNRKYGE